MSELSLVIPFYNEQENAASVVKDLQRALAKEDYELILVDNGSRDSTNQILSSLCFADSKHLKLVHVVKNEGYGNGIIIGLSHAHSPYVGYAWGDGQVPASEV